MTLQKLINLEINNILFEFKTKFNFQKFKSIESIEEKVNYAEIKLTKLGKGTARVVFLLNNRTVLKVANPKFLSKGIEQNKSEIEIFKKIQKTNLLTKIYDFDPAYEWVIAELVRPIKNKEEFKKYTNITIEDFKDIMYDISYGDILFDQDLSQNTFEKLKNVYKNISTDKYKLLNNEFLQKVIYLIEQFNLNAADLGKYFHWGKTVDDNIVLLDYGYTETLRK